MKTISLPSLFSLMLACVLSGTSARAATYTWTPTAAGTAYTWTTAANWGGTAYPNAIGDVANLTLNLAGSQTITLDAPITLGSLTFNNTTNGSNYLFTLAGSATNTLTLQAASGSALLVSNASRTANTNVVSAPVVLGSSTTIETDANLTLSGSITTTGGSGITKTGAGTLTLSGTTYAGAIDVSAGTLVLAISGSTQPTTSASSIVVESGAMASTGASQNVTIGALTLNGGTFSQAYTYIYGTITMTGGTLQGTTGAASWFGNSVVTLASATTSTMAANMSGASAKTFTVADGAAAVDLLFSGAFSGSSAGVIKAGAGWMTLSGLNSYTGATAIQAGTLSVSTLNSVSGGVAKSSLGAPVTVANGTIAIGATMTTGTLVDTGTGETTDRVINLAGTTGGATLDQSGTGALKFTSDFTATGAGSKTLTLQGSTSGTGEVAGAIVNNSTTNKTSILKAGTGTWTLSGTNTYTGATTVNAGTLLVNGSLASGSVVSVKSTTTGNAILGGIGTINGATTVGAGTAGTSIVNAGNAGAVGTLNFAGGLTFTTSSQLQFELNSDAGTIDLVTVTGTLVLGSGIASLSGTDLGSTTLALGTVLTLAQSSGTTTGYFLGETDGTKIVIGNNAFTINYLTNSITLTAVAVPEPSTWALLGLGCCLAGTAKKVRERRKDSQAII
ncbi:PEP-CTERM protein-sorting domain-containing protein [Verrucomicrobium sp. GAS474]|uniref:beta strand repeat-containing protein n=1 Tax=Verrucomicrobium sp. GAS474 TaxID=1882831 RepID=UPI00087A30DE|nr:autotransporter-associated beta strand repeat-containing protein [Verrucomicrobium sp. GAS474]SDT88493.1 PEP-CTERM protein-sorting domain-containing protein [Verrucomicrobium sp. GAS474]